MSMKRRKFSAVLDVVAACSMIAASAFLVWAIWHPPPATAGGAQPTSQNAFSVTPVPSEPLSLAGAAVMGSPSARVAMIQYSDFECPYCAKAAQETLPLVIQQQVRTGRVVLAFRHLPLERHRLAEGAARAAECAGASGRFWQMHDALFRNPRELEHADLVRRADEIGLPRETFEACLQQPSVRDKVRRDVAEATALQVRATPTFMFGSLQADGRVKVARVVAGAISPQVVDSVVGSLLR